MNVRGRLITATAADAEVEPRWRLMGTAMGRSAR